MSFTLDWNAMFNTMTTAGLIYAAKLIASLAGAVKELQTAQAADRKIAQTQYDAVNQRIDDLRANGSAVVRH